MTNPDDKKARTASRRAAWLSRWPCRGCTSGGSAATTRPPSRRIWLKRRILPKPTGSFSRDCCAACWPGIPHSRSSCRSISTSVRGAFADRSLHPAGRRLRACQLSADALPRHHQRGHRTDEELRRRGRSQVRQRRARQAGGKQVPPKSRPGARNARKADRIPLIQQWRRDESSRPLSPRAPRPCFDGLVQCLPNSTRSPAILRARRRRPCSAPVTTARWSRRRRAWNSRSRPTCWCRGFLADTDPRQLGWKTLAVNISDLAAMGARPRWVLLAYSPRADEAWLAAFAGGFACADRYG